MRVIDSDKLDAAGLLPHQRYFLEHWYSMTHMRSLDSYRVRCMNSRTIVRELSDELRVGLSDDEELRNLCEEAAATLASDPILTRRFPTTTKTIQPFLKCPPSVKENSDKKANAERMGKLREFSFAIEDLRVALERDYFACLCNDLPEAITPNNEAEILSLIGSLLSDLVDRGWTLTSLYQWHRHFLRKDVTEKYSFAENLVFILTQLSRSPQPFVVTLRLSGSNRLVGIAEYGGYSISTTPSLTPDAKNPAEQNFCKPHKTVCFATRTVEAVDHVSAATHARSSFEQLLDLLCFDYERRTVRIEETCFVERTDDGKRLLPQVLHAVPNPIETLDESEFLKFVADFDVVTKAERIASFSRWQLQAALRQYRFGRDSEGYKDKYLNWWMGLEALAHVGRGKGIGPEVRQNVSRAMIHGYLFRMVRDLLGTIKHCQIHWPRELASLTGCETLHDLSVGPLIAVLQSDTEQELLWEGCEQHPSLVFRGKAIAEWLGDPKKTAEQLELHRQHLEWHLDRLWRIRCCVVHGSPIRFKLGLFSANLEYYLKKLILFVLATFRDNEHITSLEEVFRRTSIAYDRLVAGLTDASATIDHAREAVFAEIVVKDPR
ncbi:MAG: hypothetical protein ACYC6Y_06520 [Thermoguttaceae bacterium]